MAWVFVLALALTPALYHAALNVDVDAVDTLVRDLRHSVFVDAAYLAKRPEERCSSLDGPRCFGFMTGRGFGAGAALDGPGVMPERMLHSLGLESSDLDFTTPLYTELEGLRRQLEAGTSMNNLPVLAGTDDMSIFRDARCGAAHGVMHFAELMPDRRVPLTFSRGLPDGVVATWDGKWLARSCLQSCEQDGVSNPPGLAWPLALPAPDAKPVLDPRVPVVLPPAPVPGRPGSGQLVGAGVSAVAELSGSLGYLRFSRPVVVRALFARWAPKEGAPAAVVAGRLGLESVWATHMDPKRLGERDWMDIGSGSLHPVDEIAFVGASGLELGALWVVAHDSDFSDGGSERTVLLLEPLVNTSMDAKFTIKARRISPAATPFVVSLQEAIDSGLRLHVEPSSWAMPHSHGTAAHYPGMLTTESTLPERWTPAAALRQELLEHQLLVPLLGAAAASPRAAAEALRQMAPALPQALSAEVVRERQAIVDALHGWLSSGGKWRHTVPLSLPMNGSDTAMQSYIQAKQWQTKFDLLTAAFLHLLSQQEQPGHNQLQQAQWRGAPWL